ncbi:MAG: homoserine kinase [Clostridiales bacterium]|nr:homoserine kinase [Clostridiales bacterium]MCF8023237.1 homoserine kinase [Clostridiales bacterium]
MVRVQVPASTANLGPGFDCLGMALNLYNIVEITETPAGLDIEITGLGNDSIPRNKANIVYKSAMHVFNKAGYNPPGLKIKLNNNIPVSRGLGSSASAIVGGVVAANKICGNILSTYQLLEIAVKIEGHPDNVTPALLGGITVHARFQEDIHYLKIIPPAELKAAAAIPDFHLSTKSARKALPGRLDFADAVFNVERTALLVAALQKGELQHLELAMEDRLHQQYRESMIPGMKKVFAAAKLAGARGVAVSGAGPTLIALADKNQKYIAGEMQKAFQQCGIQADLAVLELSPDGARELKTI